MGTRPGSAPAAAAAAAAEEAQAGAAAKRTARAAQQQCGELPTMDCCLLQCTHRHLIEATRPCDHVACMCGSESETPSLHSSPACVCASATLMRTALTGDTASSVTRAWQTRCARPSGRVQQDEYPHVDPSPPQAAPSFEHVCHQDSWFITPCRRTGPGGAVRSAEAHTSRKRRRWWAR